MHAATTDSSAMSTPPRGKLWDKGGTVFMALGSGRKRGRVRGQRERRYRDERLRALRPPRAHTLGYIVVGDQVTKAQFNLGNCYQEGNGVKKDWLRPHPILGAKGYELRSWGQRL